MLRHTSHVFAPNPNLILLALYASFPLLSFQAAPVPQFTDITPLTKISFRNNASRTEEKYLLESMTGGVALFILFSFTLVLLGPTLAEHLATRFGLGAAFEWTWKIAQWPIVFALVALAIAIVYYFAPDAEQEWVYLTPGSILATLLWLAGSLGFRFYVVNFGNYEATYGTIGGIILLLLWFYISGLVIVIGAELNAEIEHASPWGKDPGEHAKGEKKAIGARAAREFEAVRRT